MFLAFLGGTFLSTCMIAVRTFKAQEKTSHITMMGIVLLPLAYFTFYFGVPKVIVVGICLVGIPIEVLSAQEMLRKRTSSHCLT